MSLINRLACYLKYRKTKFRFLGTNVGYKSIRSSFSYAENIVVGDNTMIGPGANFDGAGGIEIGTGVIFAPDVIIYSRTHYFDGEILEALPFDNKVICSKVIIRDYVWVGRSVIILPGVTIEEGAVIGAGAVVSKNVPAGAVVVGNPARIVKYRDMERYNKLKAENRFVYTTFGHNKVFVRKDDL